MTQKITENEAPFITQAQSGYMKAAVIEGPRKLTWQKVRIPEPGKQQVRVRLEGCGLCASGIPVWEGRDWITYSLQPGAPGHEAWGIVDAVGPDVREVIPGDRVAILSYQGFAEFDIAASSATLKLPGKLSGIPFPGEPLGCAMNIFQRSDIKKGQQVAIVGIGFLGALLIQLVKRKGARVIAVSNRQYSLDIARANGADDCILMHDHHKIIQQVKQLTNGHFCDRVIEATGKEWPLNLAGELTMVRGKLIIAGYHQDGMRSVNIQLWNWRGLDVINAHEREEEAYIHGMKNAVQAVSSGELDPVPLMSHIFGPQDLSAAFEMMVQRPEGFVKAIIKF
jgi:threonine dehydrogenase-like Zn-dependent dehydrogenase